MSGFASIGEVAQEIGVNPKVLSDFLYRRPPGLDLDECPRVGTRRIIARKYIPRLKRLLEERHAVVA